MSHYQAETASYSDLFAYIQEACPKAVMGYQRHRIFTDDLRRMDHHRELSYASGGPRPPREQRVLDDSDVSIGAGASDESIREPSSDTEESWRATTQDTDKSF